MIVNQAYLRLMLGISSSATDEEVATLAMVHVAAENAVKQHLGYDPTQRSNTEYYPRRTHWDKNAEYIWSTTETRAVLRTVRGQGGRILQLSRLPIRAITTINEDTDGRFGQQDGAFDANGTVLTSGTDYWVQYDEPNYSADGMVWRSGSWPSEPGTIRVAYVAGYSQLELAGQASELATDTTSDANGEYSNLSVDGSGIMRAISLTVTLNMNAQMALRKKVGAGWTPGGIKTEKDQDYGYGLGEESKNISGMVVKMPAAAADELEPYVHWGKMFT